MDGRKYKTTSLQNFLHLPVLERNRQSVEPELSFEQIQELFVIMYYNLIWFKEGMFRIW